MVIHVIGFLAKSILERKIWKQITRIGFVETLVSNVKVFEKYTSQFWLLHDSDCSKNMH